MTTLLVNNLDRALQRHLGISGDLPRIHNETQDEDIYGYIQPKVSTSQFRAMSLMDGLFSSKDSIYLVNGDLIYDRINAKYGYVTQLYEKEYGYEALIYVCNAQVLIAHPNETTDSYGRKTIDWTTTVHHTDIRALISQQNLELENDAGSMLDRTLYYCYLQYLATVHQGDRIFDGTKYYLVKNIDDASFNGALKRIEMSRINV